MAEPVAPKNLHRVFATAVRVLKSRNKIGIFQLFLYALSIPLIPLDAGLALCQRRLMSRSPARQEPLIFISGYSRSGTTLLYQALARVWDVEYFNNVLIVFPRSYLLMNFLFRKIVKSRPRDFKSFYGLSWGLAGTNDGAQIFYRWAAEENFVRAVPLSSQSVRRMTGFFAAHARLFKKPLLMKNCNLYHMFEQFAAVLPQAYFIFVKRNPAKIIRSTLKAREFVQGDRTIRWEFSLKGLRGKADEDPIEEICLNVKHCFDRIESLGRKIPSERLIVIDYEEFCLDPVACVEMLTQRVFGKQADRQFLSGILRPFRSSEGPSVSGDDAVAIENAVQRVFVREGCR